MGTIYCNLGYPSTEDVVTCTAVDLVAEFVGQTRSKTKSFLEKAIGKVLVIDNTFQLLKGPFASAALQEIIFCLSSERLLRKLVVILTGHTRKL